MACNFTAKVKKSVAGVMNLVKFTKFDEIKHTKISTTASDSFNEAGCYRHRSGNLRVNLF